MPTKSSNSWNRSVLRCRCQWTINNKWLSNPNFLRRVKANMINSSSFLPNSSSRLSSSNLTWIIKSCNSNTSYISCSSRALNSIKLIKRATLLLSSSLNKSTHFSLTKLRKIIKTSSALRSSTCRFKTNKTIKTSTIQVCNKPNLNKISLKTIAKRSKSVWWAILLVSLLLSVRLPRRMRMCRNYSLSSRKPTNRRSRCRTLILLYMSSKTAASILPH